MVLQMNQYAFQVVDLEEATDAVMCLARPHHEVLHEKLAAPLEQVGERCLSGGGVEDVVLLDLAVAEAVDAAAVTSRVEVSITSRDWTTVCRVPSTPRLRRVPLPLSSAMMAFLSLSGGYATVVKTVTIPDCWPL